MFILTAIITFIRGLSPTAISILAILTAALVGIVSFHHDVVKNEDNRIKVQTDNHEIKIKGAQDEIRNSYITGHIVSDRMRKHMPKPF